MPAGIYMIENVHNGKLYIGSSVDVEDRLRHHRLSLLHGKHKNNKLQNSFNKHGDELFKFYAVEIVEDLNKLRHIEQWWIDQFSPEFNYILNVSLASTFGQCGRKNGSSELLKAAWTPDRRKAWSEYKSGKPSSMKGKKWSMASRDKLSKTKRGGDGLIIKSPDGNVYCTYNLTRFCIEHNLNRRKMRWLMSGKCSNTYSYDGWSISNA
jgi:group I intron endonuclease